MFRYLPMLVAGIVTLPVIFDAIRRGSLIISMVVVILIAAAGVGVAYWFGEIRARTCALAFALGVALVESYYFLSWYLFHGSGSAEGAVIAMVEGSVIALVGGASSFLTCTILQRYR